MYQNLAQAEEPQNNSESSALMHERGEFSLESSRGVSLDDVLDNVNT